MNARRPVRVSDGHGYAALMQGAVRRRRNMFEGRVCEVRPHTGFCREGGSELAGRWAVTTARDFKSRPHPNHLPEEEGSRREFGGR
jgi:hypothetical protein